MATKREYVIEGNTPGKPTSKRHSCEKSRRSLFNDVQESESCSKSDWTAKEESVLVQYICLFWRDAYNDKWPMTKDTKFWNSCAVAVNSACKSNRTG